MVGALKASALMTLNRCNIIPCSPILNVLSCSHDIHEVGLLTLSLLSKKNY
jgi:hypothetical protein